MISQIDRLRRHRRCLVVLVRTLVLLTMLVVAVPTVAQSNVNNVNKRSLLSAEVQRALPYHSAIRAAANRYGVNPYLLWTIAYLETRFRPDLVSPKGARGLMQFIPATGHRYGLLTMSDFHDPVRSIEAAACYVRDLNVLFDGRIDLVLAAYNAGENAVFGSGNRVPSNRETRSYVTRGLLLFNRLIQANVLSVRRDGQPQAAEFKPAPSSTRRRALRSQPVPTKSRATHSIYFSL